VESTTDGQLLRRLNEDRRRRFGQAERRLALVCECGEADCRRTVVVSVEDYDALRPGLILHPAHGTPTGRPE
jgi:hypothetical protein